MPTVNGGTAASAWGIGDLLTRGVLQVAGQAIAAAQSLTKDLVVKGENEFSVEVDMTGGAAGDLTVQVQPFESDQVTVMPVALAPLRAVGPTLSGGHVYYSAQFDVQAYDKVRVVILNNNVGAQTLTRSSWGTQ